MRGLKGKAMAVYKQQEVIDMADSPAPDLSYIKARNSLTYSVETNRERRNKCVFSDVVRVIGRKYRSEPMPASASYSSDWKQTRKNALMRW